MRVDALTPCRTASCSMASAMVSGRDSARARMVEPLPDKKDATGPGLHRGVEDAGHGWEQRSPVGLVEHVLGGEGEVFRIAAAEGKGQQGSTPDVVYRVLHGYLPGHYGAGLVGGDFNVGNE